MYNLSFFITANAIGYVHQLTDIKTANSDPNIKYFKLLLQNSKDTTVRFLFYTPEAYTIVKEKQQKRLPIKLDNIDKSPNKRKFGENDLVIRKKTKISPTAVNFPYNQDFDDNLTSLSNILNTSSPYDTVDVKGKLLTKPEESKTFLIQNNRKVKVDCLFADKTGTIKLVLWENKIGLCKAGKSYHFQNLTVSIFNDRKYLSTNEPP